MESAPATPLDSGTRLAVERTLLAHERTLMAWVRTAVSLISFGFTIYKFFEFEAGRGALRPSGLTPRLFSMIMISTGLIALALASVNHVGSLKQTRSHFGISVRSTALPVAAIVAGVGLLALGAAILRE